MAHAVLRQPLKDMTRTVYRVTGAWDAPTIEAEATAPRDPSP